MPNHFIWGRVICIVFIFLVLFSWQDTWFQGNVPGEITFLLHILHEIGRRILPSEYRNWLSTYHHLLSISKYILPRRREDSFGVSREYSGMGLLERICCTSDLLGDVSSINSIHLHPIGPVSPFALATRVAPNGYSTFIEYSRY